MNWVDIDILPPLIAHRLHLLAALTNNGMGSHS